MLATILLLVSGAVSVLSQKQQGGIPQIVVRENEPVTLFCDHQSTLRENYNYNGHSIRWMRRNVTILSADNTGQLSLDIPKTSRYDSGLLILTLLSIKLWL